MGIIFAIIQPVIEILDKLTGEIIKIYLEVECCCLAVDTVVGGLFHLKSQII